MKSKTRGATLAAVLLAMAMPSAHAQSPYPAHPVRIILPFAPGGVVDVMGRLLANKLTQEMGTSFYVDNVGGAGGNIGTQNAASAPKDGYTLLITSSSFVVNPSFHAKVPYDPIKDFSPITIAAASPNVLVVNPHESARTVQELVDAVKKAPGKYAFASAGVGTTPHLSGELFKLKSKVDIVHAPFTGAGPALVATMGDHTQMAFSGLPPAVPFIKNGSLRALAVTSPQRLAALPNVPTMAEQGFPGQEAETLLFVLAPAGTSPKIVDQLNGALGKILKMPDMQEQFNSLGFTALGTSPEQSAQRIQEETTKWARVIDASHLREAD